MSLDDVQLMIYDEYRISRTAFSTFYRIFSLTSAPRQTRSSSLPLFHYFLLRFPFLSKFYLSFLWKVNWGKTSNLKNLSNLSNKSACFSIFHSRKLCKSLENSFLNKIIDSNFQKYIDIHLNRNSKISDDLFNRKSTDKSEFEL